MLTARSDKEDKKVSIDNGVILNNLLNFFNPSDIAKLREVSPNWRFYIENQLFLFKPNTDHQLQPYLENFAVYQHQNQYLIHFDIQELCYQNASKLFKDLPFVKKCLEKARGSLIHVHISLWSPDGINYILLYPEQSCKTTSGRIIKTPGLQQPCLIEFTKSTAELHKPSNYLLELQNHESDSDATDESENTSEEQLDFNPLEIQRLYPLPEHKKHSTMIATYKRCKQGPSKLILAGLAHDKLKIQFTKNDLETFINSLDLDNLNYDAYSLRRQWPG